MNMGERLVAGVPALAGAPKLGDNASPICCDGKRQSRAMLCEESNDEAARAKRNHFAR
jgi:hypothetical protein